MTIIDNGPDTVVPGEGGAAGPHTGDRRWPSSDVVSLIGGTPLVALDRLFDPRRFRVFGKCERFNPGGSIKDRPARTMIEWALKTGAVVPGRTTVVESTSGNLGIALAQLCRFYRVDLVLVTDAKVTPANLALMRAYGAVVEVITRRDPVSGEFLPARLARVEELRRTLSDVFWPNQYANELNAVAHHTTMAEIEYALAGAVDYLFVSTGSCGTLRGCAEYVADHGLDTRVIAVDAATSVIFGPPPPQYRGGTRWIPGHGSAIVPGLLRPGLAHELIRVDDADCVRGCRTLLAAEAILAGGSSGAVISAVQAYAPAVRPGAQCVAMLSDGGDRYLDTVFSDHWVAEHLGPEVLADAAGIGPGVDLDLGRAA